MTTGWKVLRRAVAAGRWAPAVVAVVVLSFGACQKAAPKRPKRTHHPATAAEPGGEDDTATHPPAAPAPAAPTAARPPEPAVPPPRHQLSVDPNPPPPQLPPAPRHAARTPAPTAAERPAAPAPAPRPVAAPAEPAVGYLAVQDKHAGSACPDGNGKGDLFTVHGVAADDVLNVRESPDRSSTILGELPPDATGLRGTANRKKVGSSTWREIECGKLRGWVNERFLTR